MLTPRGPSTVRKGVVERRPQVEQFLPRSMFSKRYGERFFTCDVAAYERMPGRRRCLSRLGGRDGRHAVYEVACEAGEHEWTVRRRYREFARLAEAVRRKYRATLGRGVDGYGEQMALAVALLPPKTVLCPPLSEPFLDVRRASLSDFLTRILSLPRVLELAEVKAFLNVSGSSDKGGSGDSGDSGKGAFSVPPPAAPDFGAEP